MTLEQENARLKEMLYALADAKGVAVLQASAKLFQKWYEEEKANGIKLLLSEGWRDAREELPCIGELVVLCYDYGDRFSFSCDYWNDLDEKYMIMNSIKCWRRIDPPSFVQQDIHETGERNGKSIFKRNLYG